MHGGIVVGQARKWHTCSPSLSRHRPECAGREVGECLAVDSEASTDPGERPLVRGLGVERSGGLGRGWPCFGGIHHRHGSGEHSEKREHWPLSLFGANS